MIFSELGIENIVPKEGDSRQLPLLKVKDIVLRTVVLSRLPNSYYRGTLDHALAHATFPKDEIRHEYAHNGPKITKGKKNVRVQFMH